MSPAIPVQSSSISNILTARDLKVSSRAVFVRMDFNVPLSDYVENEPREILDDSRIQEALPTLRWLIEQDAKLVLASHLGRPGGSPDPKYSLEPVANRLAQLLSQEVTLAQDCYGDGIEMMIQSMKNGQILLLENLRFHAGEEKNDPDFARKLARLAPIYINDAFGAAHRKHASTYGIAPLVEKRAIGFLMEKELQFLNQLLESPKKPFFTVLGGAKVSDKIKTIDCLVRRVDGLLVGGAMAHAFAAAQGLTLPEKAKAPKPQDVQAARTILKDAQKREIPVLLPVDTLDGFDIGPKTVEKFSQILASAKTIFWNGPVGWFERPEYAEGTFALAKAIAQTDALKVVGGGDTVSAIKKSGFAEQYDHLSTGGGAVLEYLEGNGLPGIDILRLNAREKDIFQAERRDSES